MRTLPIFLAIEGRDVILIGTGAAADAKRRLIERAGGRIVGEEGEAAIAFVVVEEGAEAVAARLRTRGILVNVPDRPDLCDFLMPAIVDRDPVVVAIGTGGASAGLAAALRQRLEALLPSGLGGLANGLHAARTTLRQRFPEAGDRRAAVSELLAPGGPLDPLDPQTDVAAAIAGAGQEAARLERIAVRSADPEELTIRAGRLLGLAERVYHPVALPAAILDRARADAERIIGPPPALLPPGLSVELVWMPE